MVAPPAKGKLGGVGERGGHLATRPRKAGALGGRGERGCVLGMRPQ